VRRQDEGKREADNAGNGQMNCKDVVELWGGAKGGARLEGGE